MTDKPGIGFIGIGIMGAAMVRRLLDRGYRVTVWNRDAAKLADVVAGGAVAAVTAAEAAKAADVVLMCLLNTDAVRACVFGPDGVASGLKRGQLVVDHSTIDPAASRDMAAQLAGRGGRWVDAPVSGGPDAARHGTLTIMAGGAAEDIEAARPVLADLARNVTHMGPAGSGQVTKAINQAIVGTGFVVMAEALALAESAGIDAARLPACLAGGLADSVLLQRIYPQMQARAFEPPKSHARVLLKDLNAVTADARASGLTLPLAEAARAQYQAHANAGAGTRDSASIVERYRPKR
jgi:3-hydroxyisobutyrate dehydrogenase